MTEPTPLEIALSDHRIPWPQSIAEEIALAERQRWQTEADPSVDRPPGVKKGADVDRLLSILDSLEERREG